MRSLKVTLLLGASCCLVALLASRPEVEAQAQDGRATGEETASGRVRRQAAGGQTSVDKQQATLSLATAAQAVSASGSSTKPARPLSSSAFASSATSDDDEEGRDDEPRPQKPVRKVLHPRRPNKEPARDRNRGNPSEDYDSRRARYDDADCDDQDQGAYSDLLDNMSNNPMRYFRHMMDSVLDRMPGDFAYHRGRHHDEDRDDGRHRHLGSSLASSAATSFSTRDGGYSRLASTVTNNGRTRGVISETRNGRTKTRRIGQDEDDDDVNDEEE